jgi:hypothetical protein
MKSEQAREYKQLQNDTRLKKPVAELRLDRALLLTISAKNGQAR